MSLRGRVVERHRGHATVEGPDGERRACRTARRSLQPLVGDEVEWAVGRDEVGTITAVAPRRSLLCRIDSQGRRESVAANLTQLLVVAAASPAADWTVVDHYLVAAELANLAGAVLFNKIDLAGGEAHLDCYRRAGYPVYLVSANRRSGLPELAAALAQERSVMVGQSGVGKSSLLNALLGDTVQGVGALTAKGGHGRHTTSASILYRLPSGGELIDSPGVRNFAPYIEDAAELQHGFREFRPYLGRCRFDNCRHLAEPGCAVKSAVGEGRVCRRRYQSYERLHALLVSLKPRRGS
jgi:ribosome biogenesis GTPase